MACIVAETLSACGENVWYDAQMAMPYSMVVGGQMLQVGKGLDAEARNIAVS